MLFIVTVTVLKIKLFSLYTGKQELGKIETQLDKFLFMISALTMSPKIAPVVVVAVHSSFGKYTTLKSLKAKILKRLMICVYC